jgi:hypothetical protein
MDSVNITKGQLREALHKLEKEALQEVEDYMEIDELAPDDLDFFESVIRDMAYAMWTMVFPAKAMPKEEQ